MALCKGLGIALATHCSGNSVQSNGEAMKGRRPDNSDEGEIIKTVDQAAINGGAMKRRRLENSDEGEIIKVVDRISYLPEHVLHIILSFLSAADVIKAVMLSKRFRSVWSTSPVIDFDDTMLTERFGLYVPFYERTPKFLNFLNLCLRLREPNARIRKFRLRVTDVTRRDNRIDRWINHAILHNAEELDLDIENQPKLFYRLPQTVLSSKSITALKLKGFRVKEKDFVLSPLLMEDLSLRFCDGFRTFTVSSEKLKTIELESCYGLVRIKINAPNLRSFSFSREFNKPCEIDVGACKFLKDLTLECANITDKWFEDHVTQFLQLETLKLGFCNKLKKIKVSCTKLRTMELNNCKGLKKIEIEALNLESFLYSGDSRTCKINVAACKLLKELRLVNANVTSRWVEDHVSEFPLLENLELNGCNALERIKISHQHLRSFRLVGCHKLVEAEIHAPNLMSLSYGDLLLPLRPLMTFVISSSLVDAKLSLRTISLTTEWFLNLRGFLSFFGHCRVLRLLCESDKVLIFPEELRERLLPPLYDLKHLKIEVSSRPANYADLVNSLLWLAPHAETLSIVLGTIEKSIKLEYEEMVAEQDDSYCCRFHPIKCWRHYLKKVTMVNFENVDNKESLFKFFIENANMLDTIYDNTKVYGVVATSIWNKSET
ncbi:hypothetical protein L1049_023894 [Liquidambar formosana]|uniref:F-box domain-containing protein n=1 Tax=Liquidambar formosana TaxID=63359 RepID=A0AAP0RTL1_LIQFO